MGATFTFDSTGITYEKLIKTPAQLSAILGVTVLEIKKILGQNVVEIEIDAEELTHKQQLILDLIFGKNEYDSDKVDEIIDRFPTWGQVSTFFDNLEAAAQAVSNLAEAKAVLVDLITGVKKMARVEYWLAKKRSD